MMPAWTLVVLLAAIVFAAALGWAIGRLRAERALRAARDDHRALTQLVEGWQWRTDAGHRLIVVQPPADAGSDGPGSRVGQPAWSGLAAADAEALRERLERHGTCADIAVTDARGGTWSISAVPRHDAQGRYAGHQGCTRRRVAAAAAEPDAAATDGAAADAAAFSYTVSHDLRAPIRVVEGFTRIVKEDYGRLLDRIGLDHLERVLGAAARMNSMIDALLALSQLSNRPLARQPVNLSQIAGFVVDDLRRQQPERVAETLIEPGLVVQGDPTLLRLVLENLIGNAWKYSAKAQRAQVTFERQQQDGRVVYVVRDNGAGFDMRFADRLFGVFQRLHSANDFPGTGVGLASVRRIVQRHGGEVWAEGEVGQGAKFYFTLGG